MDNRLEYRRRARLGPRDSASSSASALAAPTGPASQPNNSSGPVLDPFGFNRKNHMHNMESEGNGDNKGQSNNNGNNNNDGGKSQSDPSSSSSGLPSGCSINNLRPMFPGCTFLNENDGSLHYSEGWSFSTSDPNGLIHTLHFTQTPGSSVSLMFNASSAIVFGLVPSGSSPPQASYSIDGAPQTSPHMAATSACVPNQQLFNSGNLDAGMHNLTIEVTTASKDQPYILDYLWLCGAGDDTDAPDTSTPDTVAHNKASKDRTIVGVVLGTVALLLAIAICVWLFVRRRRQRQARLRKLHISQSPVASWLYWNSQSDERQSMFTSSEDILANNPTYSSSSGTQKGVSYRKPAPTFLISAPPTARMSAVSKSTSLTRPASYEPPGLEDTGWYPRRMERAPSIVQP